MRTVVLLYILLGLSLPVCAQYAPQAGVSGSTAVSATDSKIVTWAKTCTIERGWYDIADKSKGKVSFGAPSNVVGKKNGGLLSLGDSGVAVITFSAPLYNGIGPDFAVFENGFGNPNDPEEAFLELAFVEVSSDGITYVRFPASSETDTPQVPGVGVYMNARKINNLAGKYKVNYGTPFDLDELKDSSNIDIDNITHVRIVDVIGDLGVHGTKDKHGRVINDPYPTDFQSGGFDLDAVAAFYAKGLWPSDVTDTKLAGISVYPNPTADNVHIQNVDNHTFEIHVADVAGKMIYKKSVVGDESIDVRDWNKGVYFITFKADNGTRWVERLVKY